MKEKLNCSIVQDILPNYIEKLTSSYTNDAVEDHLESCSQCNEVYKQMTADITNTEKIPVIELKFIKKVKRTRLLAAALCIILTLILSYMLYASEFKYKNDKSDLTVAVTEYTSFSRNPVDAYILETKEINNTLIVSFKDLSATGHNGVAMLLKGFNQRYRIVSLSGRHSDFSAVVQVFPINIKDEPYYAVSGYNLSDKVKYYGLDYNAYKNPGHLSKDRVTKSLIFEVLNPQFLDIYQPSDLEKQVKSLDDDTLYNYHLYTTSLYNDQGENITEHFRTQETTSVGGYVIGKAELFMLYVGIALIIGLGIIFTRYFLT